MKIKHAVQSHAVSAEPDLKPTSLRSYCVSVLATVRDYLQVYCLRQVVHKLLLPLVLPLKRCHQLCPLPPPMSSLRLEMHQFPSSVHPHWTGPILFCFKDWYKCHLLSLGVIFPFPCLLKPLYERKERAVWNGNRWGWTVWTQQALRSRTGKYML